MLIVQGTHLLQSIKWKYLIFDSGSQMKRRIAEKLLKTELFTVTEFRSQLHAPLRRFV